MELPLEEGITVIAKYTTRRLQYDSGLIVYGTMLLDNSCCEAQECKECAMRMSLQCQLRSAAKIKLKCAVFTQRVRRQARQLSYLPTQPHKVQNSQVPHATSSPATTALTLWQTGGRVLATTTRARHRHHERLLPMSWQTMITTGPQMRADAIQDDARRIHTATTLLKSMTRGGVGLTARMTLQSRILLQNPALLHPTGP